MFVKIYYNIYRSRNLHGRIGIWSQKFVKEGNPEYLEKNPESKVRINIKHKPYIAQGRNSTQVTLVEGERSHYWAIPAPRRSEQEYYNNSIITVLCILLPEDPDTSSSSTSR